MGQGGQGYVQNLRCGRYYGRCDMVGHVWTEPPLRSLLMGQGGQNYEQNHCCGHYGWGGVVGWVMWQRGQAYGQNHCCGHYYRGCNAKGVCPFSRTLTSFTLTRNGSSNLVFYLQSTSTVISWRHSKRASIRVRPFQGHSPASTFTGKGLL